MDFQVKYKPQTLGPIAADGEGFFFDHLRSSFAPVPGTIARGQGLDDIEFLRGIQPGGGESQTRHGTPAVLASSPPNSNNRLPMHLRLNPTG